MLMIASVVTFEHSMPDTDSQRSVVESSRIHSNSWGNFRVSPEHENRRHYLCGDLGTGNIAAFGVLTSFLWV